MIKRNSIIRLVIHLIVYLIFIISFGTIPTNDSATHLPFMIELLVAIIFCGIIFAMDIVFNNKINADNNINIISIIGVYLVIFNVLAVIFITICKLA